MLISRGGIKCFLSRVPFASPPSQSVVCQGIVSSLKKKAAEDPQALSFAVSRLVCRTTLPPFLVVLDRGCRGSCLIHCTCRPLEMPGPEPAHHSHHPWTGRVGPPLGPCPGEGTWLHPTLLTPTLMPGWCHCKCVWAELCSSECWGPVPALLSRFCPVQREKDEVWLHLAHSCPL